MAEKLDDISVSEEEFEQRKASSVPEAAGGEAPTKAKVARPSGGGGGRSGKQRAATPGFFARTGQYYPRYPCGDAARLLAHARLK